MRSSSVGPAVCRLHPDVPRQYTGSCLRCFRPCLEDGGGASSGNQIRVKEVDILCSRAECMQNVGRYVRFQTPYGYHEGVIERISGQSAIVLSPQRYIPAHLATERLDEEETKRLDLALAYGGYGGGGGYGAGRGGYGGYGGGGYGYGWGRWAVSFLIIYVLWGLWW